MVATLIPSATSVEKQSTTRQWHGVIGAAARSPERKDSSSCESPIGITHVEEVPTTDGSHTSIRVDRDAPNLV